jgi:hypothetical protein
VKRPAALLRLASRIGVVCVVVVVGSLIAVQYARLIGRTVALAHEVRDARREVARLETKRIQQDREIRRLGDPVGALPEIHDRLHLVGDNEAIIYLKRPHAR